MKKLIYKTAYKLCSIEVKMLLDKLEEHKDDMGLTVLSKNLTPSHGYLHIVNTGKFTFPERIALTSKMNDIHRLATKLSIVETIFEGNQKQSKQHAPSKILTTAGITKQALQILEQEMGKNYNNALRSHIDEHKAINKV